jgi:hypothetical protein
MREEYQAEGKQVLFSQRLLQAIAVRLERREQTMILLNRRGYSAFLLCRKCGFTFQCSACRSPLPTTVRSINSYVITVVWLDVRRLVVRIATANTFTTSAKELKSSNWN